MILKYFYNLNEAQIFKIYELVLCVIVEVFDKNRTSLKTKVEVTTQIE